MEKLAAASHSVLKRPMHKHKLNSLRVKTRRELPPGFWCAAISIDFVAGDKTKRIAGDRNHDVSASYFAMGSRADFGNDSTPPSDRNSGDRNSGHSKSGDWLFAFACSVHSKAVDGQAIVNR